jgi:hypothetical protein
MKDADLAKFETAMGWFSIGLIAAGLVIVFAVAIA